ncbi:MAG: helix-turn-helix transcriptional regulator [Clostridia bacterium]|nr:helix-turn-helix transcriptional regulator [Clostridia bacterium]
MIVYTPFWETLKKAGESTYTLINRYNISSATIDRIRKGMGISTMKVDDLCRILNCRVEDILLYVQDESSCDIK